MSTDDRKLLGLLDTLSPEHLTRLKTLADARTAPQPVPPTDGPPTYRGVGVPEVLRPNWDQPEAHWWREGVKVALGVPPYRCAHCGGVIEPTGGHDWIGPVPEPGERQKRYHVSPAFPDCRRASGACGTPEGSEQQ